MAFLCPELILYLYLDLLAGKFGDIKTFGTFHVKYWIYKIVLFNKFILYLKGEQCGCRDMSIFKQGFWF